MEVVFYFENQFSKMESFIDGNEFYDYLDSNEGSIKDFEILEVNM